MMTHHTTPTGATVDISPPPITVLIVDDYPVVRLGLRSVLGGCSDLTVVSEGPCEVEPTVELVVRQNPDVAVIGGPDAAAITARLREINRGLKVLVLSACEDAGSMRRAMTAGANGYVLVRAAAEELVRAVRAVATGGTYLDPAVAGKMVNDPASVHELSEREVQVLKMIAMGYSNKEIAAKTQLSVKTVETYKARALEKLGAASRVDIVEHAVRSGWLAEGTPVG